MALSLIINIDGYASIADKNLGIRWGNCGFIGYIIDDEDGILGCYNKYVSDHKAFSPEFNLYFDLAYQPILKWSEE